MTGEPIEVSPALQSELAGYGLFDYNYMLPKELFSFESLLTVRGFMIMVVGGFLVGLWYALCRWLHIGACHYGT